MDGLSALLAPEIVLALLAFLIVGALGFVWARRRYISDGSPVMVCARRHEASGRWRLGLARLSAERLEWFSVVGPSIAPEISWVRHDTEFATPILLVDHIPGLADPVRVHGECKGDTADFAMVPGAYTALRAWVESSPPGFNVNNVT